MKVKKIAIKKKKVFVLTKKEMKKIRETLDIAQSRLLMLNTSSIDVGNIDEAKLQIINADIETIIGNIEQVQDLLY